MCSKKSSKSSAIEAAQDRIRSNRFDKRGILTLAESVINGHTDALARAITLIESNNPSDRPLAHALLTEVAKRSTAKGSALRLGITGIPGVGKSTFIEKLGIDLIREGHKVAVLAVDPSSQRTGGSILGDKTRMEQLAVHSEAFVRPSPAADALGGVARATMEAILLCEAAGFDRIIVETVGVGQSEISVRDMVDVFCLLLIGGAGDEVQGIKRGIVEMADIVIVHKADGKNTDMCNDTASSYRNALHLFPPPLGGVQVDVLIASSITGTGHDEFRLGVNSIIEKWEDNGFFLRQRSNQQTDRMLSHARELLLENKMLASGSKTIWTQLSAEVNAGKLSPFSAAWTWVNGSEK
jgi:LAO/AO transport system kinase